MNSTGRPAPVETYERLHPRKTTVPADRLCVSTAIEDEPGGQRAGPTECFAGAAERIRIARLPREDRIRSVGQSPRRVRLKGRVRDDVEPADELVPARGVHADGDVGPGLRSDVRADLLTGRVTRPDRDAHGWVDVEQDECERRVRRGGDE